MRNFLNKFKQEEWQATSLLMGTTIGAGIFGLPYVIAQVGFIPGIFYLLFLGAAVLIVNLIYGEIILRTPGDHQLGGYFRLYLDKKQKRLQGLSSLSFFISVYGAMLAYIIGVGEFLTIIFGIGNPVVWSIFFFVLGAASLYLGLRSVAFLELLIVFLLIGIVAVFFGVGFDKISWSYFTETNFSRFFLPYGVILFAINGNAIIPEMEEILRKRPQSLKKAIILGTLIPVLVYLLFALFVVGICGSGTSQDSVSCLSLVLPKWIVQLTVGFGILAMASSFLSLSYVLKECWFRDFKFSRPKAFIFSILPSFALFFLGARNFISVLEFSGAISFGLSAILILTMHNGAKEKGKRTPAYSMALPRLLIIGLYGLFALGMVFPFLIRLGI